MHGLAPGASPAAASPQRTWQRGPCRRAAPASSSVQTPRSPSAWSQEGHPGHEAEPGSDPNPAQIICTYGMGVCDAKQYKVISCVLRK